MFYDSNRNRWRKKNTAHHTVNDVNLWYLWMCKLSWLELIHTYKTKKETKNTWSTTQQRLIFSTRAASWIYSGSIFDDKWPSGTNFVFRLHFIGVIFSLSLICLRFSLLNTKDALETFLLYKSKCDPKWNRLIHSGHKVINSFLEAHFFDKGLWIRTFYRLFSIHFQLWLDKHLVSVKSKVIRILLYLWTSEMTFVMHLKKKNRIS